MSRLELTACPTSPSARSSSTERVSSCVRSCSSLNSRTFSMAITAWSAKVWSRATCSLREELRLGAEDRDRADRDTFSHHGDAEGRCGSPGGARARCPPGTRPRRSADLRRGRSARLKHRTAGDRSADRAEGRHLADGADDRAVVGDEEEPVAVAAVDGSVERRRTTERRSAATVSSTGWMSVGELADDAQDLARRRLLLERLGEVAVGVGQLPRARLHLLLQALVGLLEARRHALNDPARAFDLVAGVKLDRLVERAGADPRRAFLEDPDRRDHPPGEEEARQDREHEAQHEDDGAPDDRGPEGRVRVRGRALDEDEPPEGSRSAAWAARTRPPLEAVGDHRDRAVCRGSRAIGPRRLHLRESGEVPLRPAAPGCPGGRPAGCGNPPRRRIRRGRPRSGRPSSRRRRG